ncbi:hypothetical protein GJ496_006973 [Pomphorhynchus laevis]|nr:hypothetical protein GJ496_006973 [Pomphorhynchus laevis]
MSVRFCLFYILISLFVPTLFAGIDDIIKPAEDVAVTDPTVQSIAKSVVLTTFGGSNSVQDFEVLKATRQVFQAIQYNLQIKVTPKTKIPPQICNASVNDYFWTSRRTINYMQCQDASEN